MLTSSLAQVFVGHTKLSYLDNQDILSSTLDSLGRDNTGMYNLRMIWTI